MTVTDPTWQDAGPYGPGMYSKGKAFSDYKGRIDELAPHIGLSIRAWGKAVKGEAAGKKGPIVVKLAGGSRASIDFVTKPGAGGRVMEIFEGARLGAQPTPPKEEAHKMDELQEAQRKLAEAEAKLVEANATLVDRDATIVTLTTENAQYRERELLVKARGIVETAVTAAKLPDITKARLTETLASNPPVVDGAIDEAKYTEAITAAIDEAATEVAAIAGGKVQGMGLAGLAGNDAGHTALYESLKRRYLEAGLSEAEAEKRATLAAKGR